MPTPISGISSGFSIPASGGKESNLAKIAIGALFAILIGLTIYYLVENGKKNQVREKCLKEKKVVDCAVAVGKTVAQTAQKVGPAYTACATGSLSTCAAALATAFV